MVFEALVIEIHRGRQYGLARISLHICQRGGDIEELHTSDDGGDGHVDERGPYERQRDARVGLELRRAVHQSGVVDLGIHGRDARP